MRSHIQITRSVMVLSAAMLSAMPGVSSVEARVRPSPAETGCPSLLINRPVRATGENFDDWIDCAAIERPHGRERSWHQPIR
jgi:hypothetical protein